MTNSQLDTVLETTARYRLLADRDHVLIALSGGPDSIALAHILHRLRSRFHLELGACYINHKLRPRTAVKEAHFCRDICRRYKIAFFYEEINIPELAASDKSGLEETARLYRYRTLEQVAAREGFTKIALGHHRDDRAETVLYHLFRGTGRSGITGFAPQRDNIIRPLYDLDRQEIEAYLKRHCLTFMTDSSNRSRRFTRNRLRHRIIPLIKKEITPAAVDNIVRFAEIMAAEEDYLDTYVHKLYHKAVSITPGDKIKLDLTDFLGYDIWLKRRLVRRLLTSAGLVNIEFADIRRIVERLDARARTRVMLRDGILADVSEESMYLYRPGRTIRSLAIDLPGQYRLEYPRLTISLDFVDDIKKRDLSGNRSTTAFVDARKVMGKLVLDGVKRGARFHPFGRPGSKKIGDFLTDQKYPRPLRDELPVIYDDQGVVWLVGIEIDHRVRLRPETEKVIRIEVAEDKKGRSSGPTV